MCSAAGTNGLVTPTAAFDVDAAWFNAFDAILPCPHLTFRCGSSLMLSTCALTHTMWSGCSILYPLALGLRTCLPESKHMLVTVCFRFASWTGLFQVVTRAFYLFSHVSFHHVVMMSERSRCVQPTCNVSYTQFLNPLYNIFSPCQPAHRLARTLPHTHVCFERVTSTVENDL